LILRVVSWQPPVAMYVEKAEHAYEPVEIICVSPTALKVCPMCEEAIGPLTLGFCQNKGCPVRVKR